MGFYRPYGWHDDTKGNQYKDRIYISYDSTNKNCEVGNISMVEYEGAKVDTGLPIFNYAVGYNLNKSYRSSFLRIRRMGY